MGSVYRKRKEGKDLGWYAAFVDTDGRRRHIATKQRTHKDARILLAEIEARVRRGLVGVPEPRAGAALTLAALAERWLSEMSGPKSASRRRSGRFALARVLPQRGGIAAARLTKADVARLVADLAQRYAPNTVRNTANALRAVLALGVRDGILSTNAASRVQLPRREVAAEWLDREEAARLLSEAERRSTDSPRDGARHVMIALALLCGLRRGEILGLRWQDIDLTGRRITVARSYAGAPKTGRSRHLPLPDELQSIMLSWQPKCPTTQDDLVCPCRARGRWGMSGEGPDHGLRELLTTSACKPLRRGWHGLRHTFASLFVQAGGDLYVLSQLLGHASVSETQVYAHLSPRYLLAERSRLRIRS